MAKTLNQIENEKNILYAEYYVKAKEKYKKYLETHMVIQTCYGDFFLKYQIENKPNTEKKIFLKNLLEEIYYVEDRIGLYCSEEGEKLLKKLGYEVTEVIVYDNKYLPTIPTHLRNTEAAAKDNDKRLLLQLDRNQTARSASWIEAGRSNVL